MEKAGTLQEVKDYVCKNEKLKEIVYEYNVT